jgi:hypothetical protein
MKTLAEQVGNDLLQLIIAEIRSDDSLHVRPFRSDLAIESFTIARDTWPSMHFVMIYASVEDRLSIRILAPLGTGGAETVEIDQPDAIKEAVLALRRIIAIVDRSIA